jgi:hypothetical protein
MKIPIVFGVFRTTFLKFHFYEKAYYIRCV